MIVFGPLWFVITVCVIYWFIKWANKPRLPKQPFGFCKSCGTHMPMYTPVCPGCHRQLVWEQPGEVDKIRA
jgi:predicted amidophosphoribosyltransferase